MTEMTPAKYALNNIELFRAAMDEMPAESTDALALPGESLGSKRTVDESKGQCHECFDDDEDEEE